MIKITRQLKKFQDEDHKAFQQNLLPNMDPKKIIGVPPGKLRLIAGALRDTPIAEEFKSELPHDLLEENLVHAIMISEEPEFLKCMTDLENFISSVDNWLVCDTIDPAVFKKHKGELFPYVYKWLDSEHEFTARLAVSMMTEHFLGEEYKPEFLVKLSGMTSDKYYVNMALSEFFASALAKHWDDAFNYFEMGKLDPWINNRAIQFAKEKHRISEEQYEMLLKCKR